MTSREALDKIKDWVEYITRLDYVEPIVRGEVKEALYNAYHKTTPEFKIIEKDLEILEIFKKHLQHYDSYYKNQAEWSREGFRFVIESDNIWLNEEQREQYIKDFNKLKEWYFKEVKND